MNFLSIVVTAEMFHSPFHSPFQKSLAKPVLVARTLEWAEGMVGKAWRKCHLPSKKAFYLHVLILFWVSQRLRYHGTNLSIVSQKPILIYEMTLVALPVLPESELADFNKQKEKAE